MDSGKRSTDKEGHQRRDIKKHYFWYLFFYAKREQDQLRI
jgi:hypothetical protein